MNIININKKASYDFTFIKKFEAGIVLFGNEIKSIRIGNVNLTGSFCKFVKNELFAFNVFISKYEKSNNFYSIDERRPLKLLLKRKELNYLRKRVLENGLSIIPLKIYLKNNKCKLEISLSKGQKKYDKRNSLKEKTIEIDLNRSIKF